MIKFKHSNLESDENLYFQCDWNVILDFANSTIEKSRAYNQNKNLLIAPYPLTKEYLQNYYNNTNFYLKNSMRPVDCASPVYSYFVQTYGKSYNEDFGVGFGGGGATAESANAGLNPFFGFLNIDLSFLPSWLWLLLIGGVYIVVKKK